MKPEMKTAAESHSSSIDSTRAQRDDVLKGVVGVVAEQMGMAVATIKETDALEEDLGCDSLDVVEIIMELEEHFDISIPDEFADKVKTIGQATDGIVVLLGSRVSESSSRGPN